MGCVIFSLTCGAILFILGVLMFSYAFKAGSAESDHSRFRDSQQLAP